MNNTTTANTCHIVPDADDGLEPSERFARLAKKVFAVKPSELADLEARSKMEKAARKHGPPKGTPNWKTKLKQAREQPPRVMQSAVLISEAQTKGTQEA